MALSLRLDLRQTQSLVMTPQLQQAVKLLQLCHQELALYVEREIEQNPLLERDEPDREEEPKAVGGTELDRDGDRDGDQDETEPAAPDTFEITETGTLSAREDAILDTDYDNLWHTEDANRGFGEAGLSFANWGVGGRSNFPDSNIDLEQTVAREANLRDHLLGQLNVDIADPVDRIIGLHLIDLLDEAGYLIGDLASIASLLDCDVARVEATLERLQRFDPPGIFARGLAECLALQLRDQNRLDGAMQALLDHLDLLARHDSGALKKTLAVDARVLAKMVAEIRSLDPKPGLAFELTIAQPVTPDVLMRPQADGGWLVEVNNETLPLVLVNIPYHARVSREARRREEKAYIAERFQAANWLVKALHQRANTILKVATEIVRQQGAFFVRGVQHLKPLVLRDIAEAIGMHESTVSRVTNNKYMATPRGIYELKYFFTPAIPSSVGGDSHSAEAVRFRIKTLIDEESADGVLSDDKIVGILDQEGIHIARRTVAKYREAMRIPSSVQRRREKAVRV
ncbi:MAG: RNA polymerase factor sigma-54 [Proteobacteria bacterium]|nr:RNA polymerase factor sigma-54 [Pseudomonadota bacterium]